MIKYDLKIDLQFKTECIIFPIFEDKSFFSQISPLKFLNDNVGIVHELKDFKGEKLQLSLLYNPNQNTPRTLFVGLGKEKDFNIRTWKQAIGSAIIYLESKKIINSGLFISEKIIKIIGIKNLGQSTVIAIETASYAFDDFKSIPETKVTHLEEVSFVLDDGLRNKNSFLEGVKNGKIIGQAVNFARHLGNIPPIEMTPTLLSEEAKNLAKNSPKIRVKVLEKRDMEKLGMGCLLGVSQGSVELPKFIIIEYFADHKKVQPYVLVGKGITYDSGGISIKNREGLLNMKFDMLGAATIMATIKCAHDLGLKKNIVGLVPATENMPGGSAYRPDDILRAMNGITIEIGNTDAEGRLILADALSYAKKYEPKEVIDVATLTGHALVAIGTERSAIFTPEENIFKKIQDSAEIVGEQIWRLPLGEEFIDAIKSEVADIRNIGGVGGPMWGGACTAAEFLHTFVSYPWAHIDMSCCYYEGKGKPWIRGGANGWGVETLVEYLR